METDLTGATLAALAEGVVRTDAEGRIDYLNPVAERLTGWSLDEARGQVATDVLQLLEETSRNPPWDLTAPSSIRDAAGEGILWAVLVNRQGRELPVRASAAPLSLNGGPPVGAVVSFRDMAEVRRMEREMVYLAHHDPLTGLVNRREFERRLDELIRRARSDGSLHTVCYLDLDDFKVVNDTCGHIAGDAMLRQVADRLQTALRPDDVLGRLGGDEFGVLFPECEVEQARSWAEEMLLVLEGFRFFWKDKIFNTGASVGLVEIHPHSNNPTGVLSAADAACYVAKDRGRNRIHVYEPDDTAIGRRRGDMQWVQRLQRAIERQSFRLYYQDILPLRKGVEAAPDTELFLRLVDSNGQAVEPEAFISVAERYHLITELDKWVVRQACRLLGRDADGSLAGQRVFSINVSGPSLSDDTFLAFVIDQLETTGADASRICFEITETAAISHMARARIFFDVLGARGCCFGLDDFGSGLSSFAYLRDLPVDFLKIDASFVRRLTDDPVNAEFVRAIHRVGKVMDVRTIAEGVEDDETLEALREIGLDYAQGYWLQRPQPLE